MRLVALLLAGALCATTAGCGATIAKINARPERYYQKKIDFDGRLARRQDLPGETLLEVMDRRGARILVRADAGLDATAGDWVRVRGILVPEARVGETTLYDVVAADSITKRRAPRLPDFM
jgi:hypothetical protein